VQKWHIQVELVPLFAEGPQQVMGWTIRHPLGGYHCTAECWRDGSPVFWFADSEQAAQEECDRLNADSR